MALVGGGTVRVGGIDTAIQQVYNITAATVVKASPGYAAAVSVIVAGSAAGAVYDSAATTGNSAANQIAVIPNTVGVITLRWPTDYGFTVVPGTGQTLAVSYA